MKTVFQVLDQTGDITALALTLRTGHALLLSRQVNWRLSLFYKRAMLLFSTAQYYFSVSVMPISSVNSKDQIFTHQYMSLIFMFPKSWQIGTEMQGNFGIVA